MTVVNKIKVMSDLHLEFHPDLGDKFIDSLPTDGVDVLVLAGDITSSSPLIEAAVEKFCAKFNDVIYVAGNHEYYGCTFDKVNQSLDCLSDKISNFHWLNHNSVTIGGQRFIGGTLWFKDDPEAVFFRDQIGDFKNIENLDSWVYQENEKAVKFLEENVGEDDIVVTHHLPTWFSVSDEFLGSPLNRFFVCDLEHLILNNKPKVWMHGHTHNSFDYLVGSTRVICNPYGYKGFKLNEEFNSNLWTLESPRA